MQEQNVHEREHESPATQRTLNRDVMIARRSEAHRLTPAPVDTDLHDMLTWTDFPAQLTLRRNRAGQLAIQQHTVAATRVRVSRVSRDHKGRHKSVRLTSLATELQREALSDPVAS